jgi:hypothetical protein
VNVIVEIVVVRSVNPDMLPVGDIGIQLYRFPTLEVHELSQIEDTFPPVVLAHNRDHPFEVFLNAGNF